MTLAGRPEKRKAGREKRFSGWNTRRSVGRDTGSSSKTAGTCDLVRDFFRSRGRARGVAELCRALALGVETTRPDLEFFDLEDRLRRARNLSIGDLVGVT